MTDFYVNVRAVSARYIDDARHVATATVYEMDILASWNFTHLANVNKQIVFNGFNRTRGYLRELLLVSPMELCHEDE